MTGRSKELRNMHGVCSRVMRPWISRCGVQTATCTQRFPPHEDLIACHRYPLTPRCSHHSRLTVIVRRTATAGSKTGSHATSDAPARDTLITRITRVCVVHGGVTVATPVTDATAGLTAAPLVAAERKRGGCPRANRSRCGQQEQVWVGGATSRYDLEALTSVNERRTM